MGLLRYKLSLNDPRTLFLLITYLSHLRDEHARGNGISPDPMPGILRGQSLGQVIQRRLARVVDIAGGFGSGQAAEAGGADELALQQPALSDAVRVRVPGAQQAQEGDEREVRAGYVGANDFACVFVRRLVPQLFLELGNSLFCRSGRHVGDLPEIARVGDDNVDEWRVLSYGRHCSLQRFFRADITYDRNERPVLLIKNNQ